MFSAFRVSSVPGPPARVVTFTAAPTGELAVVPGVFMTLADQGQRQQQRVLSVRNQTGRTLQVRVKVAPSTAALGDEVSIAFTAGGRAIIDGHLGEVGSASAPTFVVPAGASVPLEVAAALTQHAAPQAADTAEDVALSFDATPVGA